MNPLSPWQTLESVRDQSAVRRSWQRRLGERFPVFCAAFLERRPEPVSLYPCPLDQPCPHRVIHFPDGSIRAVCECPDRHCPDIPLTPDDIVCWQLNWPKLGRMLCTALGLDPKPAELNLYNTRQIGSWSAHAIPVILNGRSGTRCNASSV